MGLKEKNLMCFCEKLSSILYDAKLTFFDGGEWIVICLFISYFPGWFAGVGSFSARSGRDSASVKGVVDRLVTSLQKAQVPSWWFSATFCLAFHKRSCSVCFSLGDCFSAGIVIKGDCLETVHFLPAILLANGFWSARCSFVPRLRSRVYCSEGNKNLTEDGTPVPNCICWFPPSFCKAF